MRTVSPEELTQDLSKQDLVEQNPRTLQDRLDEIMRQRAAEKKEKERDEIERER